MPNRDPTICALQQKSKVIVPRHVFPHFSFGESQGVKPDSVWPIKFQRVTHTEILICKAIMLNIVATNLAVLLWPLLLTRTAHHWMFLFFISNFVNYGDSYCKFPGVSNFWETIAISSFINPSIPFHVIGVTYVMLCYVNIRYVVHDVKRKQIQNLEFNAILSLSFTDVYIIILKFCPCFILTSYLYIWNECL